MTFNNATRLAVILVLIVSVGFYIYTTRSSNKISLNSMLCGKNKTDEITSTPVPTSTPVQTPASVPAPASTGGFTSKNVEYDEIDDLCNSIYIKQILCKNK